MNWWFVAMRRRVFCTGSSLLRCVDEALSQPCSCCLTPELTSCSCVFITGTSWTESETSQAQVEIFCVQSHHTGCLNVGQTLCICGQEDFLCTLLFHHFREPCIDLHSSPGDVLTLTTATTLTLNHVFTLLYNLTFLSSPKRKWTSTTWLRKHIHVPTAWVKQHTHTHPQPAPVSWPI